MKGRREGNELKNEGREREGGPVDRRGGKVYVTTRNQEKKTACNPCACCEISAQDDCKYLHSARIA